MRSIYLINKCRTKMFLRSDSNMDMHSAKVGKIWVKILICSDMMPFYALAAAISGL